MMARPAESSMDLAPFKVGSKLANWAIGAIAGIGIIIAAGGKFYATKDELNSARMEIQDVKIRLEIQGKQISDMRDEQMKSFAKMETNFEKMQEILLSQKRK